MENLVIHFSQILRSYLGQNTPSRITALTGFLIGTYLGFGFYRIYSGILLIFVTHPFPEPFAGYRIVEHVIAATLFAVTGGLWGLFTIQLLPAVFSIKTFKLWPKSKKRCHSEFEELKGSIGTDALSLLIVVWDAPSGQIRIDVAQLNAGGATFNRLKDTIALLVGEDHLEVVYDNDMFPGFQMMRLRPSLDGILLVHRIRHGGGITELEPLIQKQRETLSKVALAVISSKLCT
jgi:hypothetical protein